MPLPRFAAHAAPRKALTIKAFRRREAVTMLPGCADSTCRYAASVYRRWH